MEICISCLSTEDLLNIFETYIVEGDEENYVDMFKACYDIEISKEDGSEMICLYCIDKLRGAYHFKRQTLNTKDILITTQDMKVEMEELKGAEYLEETALDNASVADDKESCTDYDIEEQDISMEELLRHLKQETVDDHSTNGKKKFYVVEEKDQQLSEQSIEPKSKHSSTDSSQTDQKKKKKRLYKPDRRPYVIEPGQKTCHLCNEEFISQRLLVMHMNIHFPNHMCEVCGKRFATKLLMKRHQKGHDPGPFFCKYCNMEYRNRNTLMAHVRFKHRDGLPYRCPECNERFRSFHQKLSHLKVDHGQTERKYGCEYCPEKFYYAGQRWKHINHKHLHLKPYKCTECSSVFATKNQLQNHLAHAHKIGEKKHQCHICHKKYCVKRSLLEHLRIHANDRKYRCEVCKTGFIQKCSLKGHVATHLKYGQVLKMEGDSAVLEV